MAASRIGPTVSEFGSLGKDQRSGLLGAASLLVFVVTGVLWLAAHLETWPGGYLPWMLSLAFLLFAATCFSRFHYMRMERDRALEEGKRVVAVHGTVGTGLRVIVRHRSPGSLLPALALDRELRFSDMVFTIKPPNGGAYSATWSQRRLGIGEPVSRGLQIAAGNELSMTYPDDFSGAPEVVSGRYDVSVHAELTGDVRTQHLASAAFQLGPLDSGNPYWSRGGETVGIPPFNR